MKAIRLLITFSAMTLAACGGGPYRADNGEASSRCRHDCAEYRKACPAADAACEAEYPRCVDRCEWVEALNRGEIRLPPPK